MCKLWLFKKEFYEVFGSLFLGFVLLFSYGYAEGFLLVFLYIVSILLILFGLLFWGIVDAEYGLERYIKSGGTLNRKKVLCFIKSDKFALHAAGDEFQKEREIVLEAVKKHGASFESVADQFKSDSEVIWTAIKTCVALGNSDLAFVVKNIDKKLMDQKDFVLDIINTTQCGLHCYLSTKLKADKDVVLAMVRLEGDDLGFANDELKADREVVLAAVKNRGYALRFASDELKADREVVLAAIKGARKEYFRAPLHSPLEFASEKIRADKELVLQEVKKVGSEVLKYTSESLKGDHEILYAALCRDAENKKFRLEHYDEKLKSDKAFLLEAIKVDIGFVSSIDDELRKDRKFVFDAVMCDYRALGFFDEYKNDKEIIMAAVKNNYSALNYASRELQKDPEVFNLGK